jgi:hypothetical protein
VVFESYPFAEHTSKICLEFYLTVYQNNKSGECSKRGGGDVRNSYRILVGKPERKGTRGRPRRRWTEINRK